MYGANKYDLLPITEEYDHNGKMLFFIYKTSFCNFFFFGAFDGENIKDGVEEKVSKLLT